MSDVDAVELAGDLIRLDSAMGKEQRVAARLRDLLVPAGLAVEDVELAPGRSSLLAHVRGGGRLVLSGHLDTVAAPAEGWTSPPFAPTVRDGRLYGRGSSDMKAGVAAMCVAALRHLGRHPETRGFTLAFTASEETGSQGAATILDRLAADAIVVIGESTANRLRYGHKGATWLEVSARGLAAHGSRPDLGRNAIDEVIGALAAGREAVPVAVHDPLGAPTWNLGTISGGVQTNMVADHVVATVDVRTVPGTDPAVIEEAMHRMLGEGEVRRILHLPPVWTDPASPASRALARAVARVTGSPTERRPSGTSYFTDAAVLAAHPGVSAYILGPGDPDQPHTVDESCDLERIEEAVEIYGAILEEWDLGAFD